MRKRNTYFAPDHDHISGLWFNGEEFWKNYMFRYFGQDLIEKWNQYSQIEEIESNGKKIHLEIYDSNNRKLPTIIFSHGIAGYGRLMLPFIIPLREAGYTIITPDLQGYGYNEGKKGRFSWDEHVINLIDTVEYAIAKFSNLIILAGASMGGPLAYEAVARGADIVGLICWCLWELNDKEFIRKSTQTKWMTPIILPLLGIGVKHFGNLQLKAPWVISYKTLSEPKSGLEKILMKDPQAGRFISLQAAFSLMKESTPTIKYEEFEKPILIFHPGADLMVPTTFSLNTFKRLGSKNKKYIELPDAAHFPIDRKYYQEFANRTDDWIKENFFD